MKIIIINGPNLNLLGKRQQDIYGDQSFEDYFHALSTKYPEHELSYFQSNHEGLLIDKIQEVGFSYDGIVLNAAGYTHTSIALMDSILAITTPVVEVHISNIHERETYRHHSYVSEAAQHVIIGKGLKGYDESIHWLETQHSKNSGLA